MSEISIPFEKILRMREGFLKNDEKMLRMNAVTKSGIDAVSQVFDAPINTPNVFSRELKSGEVTSQNGSGRCWLFAALNILRLEVMKTCELDSFELSQPYLFFWDKLEKANYFLENILNNLEEAQGSRLLSFLLGGPFNDGGQWDMIVSLVEKYGIVPKSAMPESHSTSNSGRMNKFLTLKAREYAKILRDGHKNGLPLAELREKKDGMLAEVFDMLCLCMGVPPVRFDFECRGKEERFTRDLGLTPHAFYEKYVGTKLRDYVSLINSPTDDKPDRKSTRLNSSH